VTPLRLYLDVCCLNRPFDDQSQDKVRLETEAIISILKQCDAGDGWKLVGSDALRFEISKNTDSMKRQKLMMLHRGAAEKIKYNAAIKTRAAELRMFNVKLFDSLHLATAEYANVDAFLSTDVRLIKAAARSDIKIRVDNPLKFYLEVLYDE
jgi:hypothetical protein